MTQITKGNWLVRDIIHVDEPHKRIYFTGGGREGGNPYYRYLYRVNYDGSGLKLLSPEHADHMLSGMNQFLAIDGGLAYQVVSPSGKYVVYNYSTPSQPTQTVIRATSDGHLVSTFETADPTALYAAGYRPPTEFTVKAADGKTDLWGVIYRPADFDSTRHYPIVDVEYASPLTAAVPRTFPAAIAGAPAAPPTPPSLTQLGFVVVVIDARGTPYRSRDFGYAGYGRFDLMGLDDHVAAIKQLGERFPYMDTSRVGIMGASFGGMAVFRGMLDFPDFYKVGVAGSPPGSLQNMYIGIEPWQGEPVYSDGSHIRPTPTEVPSNYVAVDGRQQAAKLKGHLLIMMGELDENALPASTLQFMDALMKANRDFDLIYMPNQNHTSGYAAYGNYTTRRVEDYFVRYLLGATPPAWNEKM